MVQYVNFVLFFLRMWNLFGVSTRNIDWASCFVALFIAFRLLMLIKPDVSYSEWTWHQIKIHYFPSDNFFSLRLRAIFSGHLLIWLNYRNDAEAAALEDHTGWDHTYLTIAKPQHKCLCIKSNISIPDIWVIKGGSRGGTRGLKFGLKLF